MKRHIILGAMLVSVFSGCTGDVGRFYTSTGATGNKKVRPLLMPANESSWKSTVAAYVSGGYKILGWSNFSNLTGNERATALAQGKKVGADIIV